MLVSILLVGALFALRSTVNAQTSYITVYGQLDQFQCPVGAVSGPCTGLSLTTNGTTPGIPNSPMLDFSQSIVSAPAQSDIGKQIMATGYYGQESPCTIVDSCPAFFVHIWGPYLGQLIYPTSTGNSNPQMLSSSGPIVYVVVALALAVVVLGCFHFREEIFR